MTLQCPKCLFKSDPSSGNRTRIQQHGYFYRQSDRKKVLRFFCPLCHKSFSQATRSKCYWQKKRQLNHQITRLLVSGVSQREGSKILKINRKTFVRKFIFMGQMAKQKLLKTNKQYPKSMNIQFDDLETFEHTKCKPLSITLAVEEKTRRILHFEVAQMPAKGLLAAISRKKYGRRADHRLQARLNLLKTLKNLTHEYATVKTDLNPHYPLDLKKHFPKVTHLKYKGRKGAIVGQGELKKIGFDPLFDLNHTCATFRARMNRLFRRTWCTTKKPERLDLHLALTALHHNLQLNL